METKVHFIVGKQKDNHWAGVFGYKPDNRLIFDHLGEMFAVVRLQTQANGIGLESIAGLLLDSLQEAYYDRENAESDSLVRLEDAIWKMRSRLDSIIAREEKISKKGLDMEMGVVTMVGQLMYCAVVGESRIFMKREDSFVDVSGALIDANMMGFLRSGSLGLESNDRIALTTSKVVMKGQEVIESTLTNLDMAKLDPLKDEYGVGVMVVIGKNLDWVGKEKVEELAGDDVEVSAPVSNSGELEAKDTVDEEKDKIVAKTDEGLVKKTDWLTGEDEKENELDENEYPLAGSPDEPAVMEDIKNESENVPLVAKITSMPGKLTQAAKMRIESFRSKKEPSVLAVPEKVKEERAYPHKNKTIGQVEEEESTFSALGTSKNGEGGIKVGSPMSNLASKINVLWNRRLKKYFTNNKTYAKLIRDVVGFVRSVVSGAIDWFKREIIGVGVDRRDLYSRKQRMKRNRRLFVIIVLVLGVSLFLIVREARNQKRFNETVESKRAEINQIGSELTSLNPQIQDARNQGEDKKNLLISELDEAAQDIERLKKDPFINENPETFQNEVNELNSLQTRIQNNKDLLLLISPFTQAQIISDVGKIYPDASLTDIEYSNGYVFVSDSAKGAIYRFNATDLDVRAENFVSGLSSPRLLVRNVAGDIIFFDSDPTSAVGRFNPTQGSSVSRFAGLTESNIGSVKEAAIYGGNDGLYEVHQNHQQIFKRSKVGEEYEGGGSLFNPDAATNWRNDPEFGSAIDIAAPYELYVLIQGKGIKRYLGGEENTLSQASFSNLLQKDFNSLSQASSLDVKGNYLAVGDPTNKRVLLFEIAPEGEKALTFVKQFVYRGDEKVFNQINEVVIDEVNKKIFVLDGSKVIRLDI